MRLFTIAEAEAMIPQLERMSAAIADLRARSKSKAAAITKLESESDAAQLAIERAQADFIERTLEELLSSVEAMGAALKGLEPFLVDFPFRMEGRRVWLCWRQGEKTIRHFHGLEEGFSGRRPVPDHLLPS